MQFLTEWVMQIITFIFIASIAQMIIPSDAYKKYIQMVIGLLLLFILTKPIIFFLQMDLSKELERVNDSLFQEIDHPDQFDQASPLEEERDTYIWNEVKNVMMQEANEQLQGDGIEIMDMSFYIDESNEVEKIQVQVIEKNEETNDYVESVQINVEKSASNHATNNKRSINRKLAAIWQIDQNLLDITWQDFKGGE